MTTGVICTAGITAMINAEIHSSPFNPNVVKVSNLLFDFTGSETSLPDIVWTAPSTNVTQIGVSNGILRTIVYMDLSVGDFDVATIGIFDSISGVLFALAAFPGAGKKLSYIPPSQAGNIRTFYIDLAFANVLNLLTESTSISVLTIAQVLANASGSATARQLRTALNNSGYLGTVEAAIASSSYSNRAVIDWQTCASTTLNSPLMNFIASATSQTDQGASILAAAMLLPA